MGFDTQRLEMVVLPYHVGRLVVNQPDPSSADLLPFYLDVFKDLTEHERRYHQVRGEKWEVGLWTYA